MRRPLAILLLPFLLLAAPLRADPTDADRAAFAAKRAALPAHDSASRLTLARWCRDRELWTQCYELCREVLALDPDSRAAYGLLKDYDDNVRLPEDSALEAQLRAELKDRFHRDFKVRNTRHYLVLYDTPESFVNVRVAHLEKAWDAFLYWFNLRTLRPQFLSERLVVILFQQRDDYLAYAQAADRQDVGWTSGYYSQRTNRVAFFDDSTSPQAKKLEDKLEELRAIAKDLAGQIDNARRAGAESEARALTAERTALLDQIQKFSLQLDNRNAQTNTTKTVHEAIHMLSFNTGIQKRRVNYPLWLSEGIACAFEFEDRTGTRGPALVNYGRAAVLKPAVPKDATKLPLPFSELLAGSPENVSEKQLGLYYAEGWALLHFLYRHHRPGLESHLQSYLRQPAAKELTPDQHRKLFTDAFGDLPALEAEFLAYLKTLPTKP